MVAQKGNTDGSWLPEDKKANMEGEYVVAYGRLPSPAPFVNELVKSN